jgi:hypothetical protein
LLIGNRQSLFGQSKRSTVSGLIQFFCYICIQIG